MAGAGILAGVALAGRTGVWDIAHAGGRITAISPSQARGGGFVMPLMADIHVHLDKTLTAHRMPRAATSLFDAIAMMAEDAQTWTADDLRHRADTALTRAWHHGTALMRSHVDWSGPQPPAAWSVLSVLAADWRGRVDLQLSSLTRLDLLAEIGPAIARHLQDHGGVLGAFVYRNDDLATRISGVFDLAEAHGLDLDFHVDEGLDAEATGIDAIIAETARRGMGGRVLCGHGCALSIRPPDQVARLLDEAARAGVALTVLPGANLYLQDGATGRTPRLRGLAPLIEAQAAGMPVMIGSDNVRDGFFPYGDYDLWDMFRLAVIAGHLPPGDWLSAISQTPARWMGRDLGLTTGGSASFVWIDADDLPDALARPRATRRVWRDGQILGDLQGDAA